MGDFLNVQFRYVLLCQSRRTIRSGESSRNVWPAVMACAWFHSAGANSFLTNGSSPNGLRAGQHRGWETGPQVLGLYSLSGKTSYRKISWILEAARFWFKIFQSLWNLAGTSTALLPRCLSNFRAIRPLQHSISRLRGFTRFGGKTSYRLVNKGSGDT